MRIWSSAILGLVIFCLMLLIGWFFGTDTEDDAAEEDHPRLLLNWMTALLIGAAVGAINFALPYFYPGSNLAFIAPICLVVMIGIIAYLIYLWRLEGSSFRELVPMVVLTVLLFLTTKAAAVMTAGLVGIRFFYTLILVIPELCLVCAIGYYLSNLFSFRFREISHRQLDRALAIITRVVTVLLATILLCTRVYWGGVPDLVGSAFRMPDYSQEMKVDEDFVDGAVAEVTDLNRESWYGFYNLMLQTDVDPRNDFNFGPNPYEEGATAKYFDEVIRYRGVNDPAFGSVMCGWTDANAGTRYEGEFYESCEGDWAKTLNLTKERFMGDQSQYYQTMNALFDFYDTADVSLEYRPSGLDDQMYMNPHTIDGVPDIIVMTTADHDGYFLTYTFNIKGSTVKVSYRIDCGFQPTNVQEIMHITPDDTPRSNPQPQSEPEKKEDPKPQDTKDPKPQDTKDPKPKNDPQPENPGNGDTPPSNPPSDNPPSQPVKVPSQSPKTNTVPNDDPGPSSSTNNGVGATTSTADTPSSAGTNHFDTVPEAIAGTQQNQEVNQNQKTGSDNNTPTVSAPAPAPAPASDPAPAPAPAPVAVDNNGDSGGANDSTTPPPVAISTDTGEAVDANSAGDSWGAPPD